MISLRRCGHAEAWNESTDGALGNAFERYDVNTTLCDANASRFGVTVPVEPVTKLRSSPRRLSIITTTMSGRRGEDRRGWGGTHAGGSTPPAPRAPGGHPASARRR